MIAFKAKIKAYRLERLIDNIENLNMTELHADMGEEAVNIIGERFDEGRDPKGRRWKKIKRYFNRDANRWRTPADTPLKLLHLFRSFSYDANDAGAIVGTPLDYAKYHTDAPFNNGAPRRIIPLREFMGFESDKDITTLLDIVEDHVERALDNV